MCCLSQTVTYSTTMNKVNATSKHLGDHYVEISITLINTFTIFGAFPMIFGSDSKISLFQLFLSISGFMIIRTLQVLYLLNVDNCDLV